MKSVYPLAGLLALSALAAPALAAPPVVLKTAAQILDASAKATGVSAAAKIKTMVIKGTLSIPAQNIKGSTEIKSKSPSRFLMFQTIPGIGDIVVGYDGKVGWSRDPINGLRELKGAELEQTRTQNDAIGELQWRKRYVKAELLPDRPVAGVACYVVRLTPKAGAPVTQYIARKTLLLQRSDIVVQSPNGKLPTENYFGDYRNVAGVKMAFLNRTIAASQEFLITFSEIKTNVPIDDAIFLKPTGAPDKPAKMDEKKN